MAKLNKFPYVCLIYEPGDYVIDKFGDNPTIHHITMVRNEILGKQDVQLISFADGSGDDFYISSHFAPAGESIAKYANGVPTKGIIHTNVKVGVRKKSKFTQPVEEETFAPFIRIIKKSNNDPIKEGGSGNETT